LTDIAGSENAAGCAAPALGTLLCLLLSSP
jgi:hypothetical protein